MCGLNAIFAYHPAAGPVDGAELRRTRDSMAARGPDGAGEWIGAGGRIGLGHRRLSILDLSERANQPLASEDGLHRVVFNGEIYNYPELRRGLEAEGAVFRTGTDTEVLIHLYRREGPGFVRHLRGMYAFALWDGARGGLLLARDPYGIKPLYVADDGWTLRVASQVKALIAGGAVRSEADAAGIAGFFIWGAVPEPFTIHRAIRAVPAGASVWVDLAGPHPPVSHGDIAAEFAAGAARPLAPAALCEAVREAALDSVRAHLLADVEVGVFLSAGIDSGAILGLMRDAGQERVRAITLAFAEFRGTAADEAPLAAEVARRYGATHRVRTVGEREFTADLPRILEAMDQPSIDGVNAWFVAKAAREEGLKVALSGAGGDELLAGYSSFREIPRWVRLLGAPSRVPGAAGLARMLGRLAGRRLPRKAPWLLTYGGTYPGAYLLRRALFLPFELGEVLDPEVLREGLRRLDPVGRLAAATAPLGAAPLSRVAALESVQYLRNQLLRDCDWAGMAHGLEIRTPLVDVSLLRALAPAIPAAGGGAGKAALANAPSRPLPASVTVRTKTGFSLPAGTWMARSIGTTAGGSGIGPTYRAFAREVYGRSGGPGLRAFAS